MDAGKIFGRSIAFPPHIGADGRLAWSEGEVNVRESIQIILMTNLNERITLPVFGGNLKPFLFEPNTVTTRFLIQDRIIQALRLWEPRINVESVEVVEDPADSQAAIATIYYKLVATQVRERVSLGLSLAS
ncbi:MAG TPA: GPW/gp25 family protein [Chloroflexia bacterium]|nr:GPW/gp25 family protein [Chloroflexia bacterium]